MSDWIARAERQIENDLANGDITEQEYNDQMRDLQAEIQGAAEEAAEQAYNDVCGGW